MTVDNLGPSLRHHIAKVIKATRETAPANGTTPTASSNTAASDAWEATPAGPEPASPADGWPDQPPF